MKKSLVVIIFLSAVALLSGKPKNETVEPAEQSGAIVTRHIVEGVIFEADSVEYAIWDLTSALETGIYDLRFRTDADSVFDITARGQRLDFRINKDEICLWGLETSRMRLADSIGLRFAALPLCSGVTNRTNEGKMTSIGFSLPQLPDSISMCSGIRNKGIMLFPDGDSLGVARHDVEVITSSSSWQLSYWFADSILLPVARQYVFVDSLNMKRVAFSYTYPSEMEAAKEVSKQVLDNFPEKLYSQGLFNGKSKIDESGRPLPQGSGIQRNSDSGDGKHIDIPLSSTPPGERFSCTVSDVKGVVWDTCEGLTDFNRARVAIGNLPTGYYLISVFTSSGEQNSVKHYHEEH